MSIEQQIELERTMINRGRDTYLKGVENAISNGRAHETTAARRLMNEMILPISKAITEWCDFKGAGSQGKIRPLLRVVNPESAAYIALQALFNSFADETPVTGLASKIGRMIEDELRFTHFEIKHANYYDEIMKDFKRKGTKSYQHKHRVLTHKANEYEDGWNSWLPSEHAMVGTKMLDFILQCTDLIEKQQFTSKRKTHTVLVPTDAAQKWMDEHHEIKSLMFPDRMPCIIEPDEWTGIRQGGYYTPELRTKSPLIKAHTKAHRRYLENADLTNVMEAINAMQRVEWRVNERILAVAQDVWKNNLQIGMPGSDKMVPEPSPFPDIKPEDMTPEQTRAFEDWKFAASDVYTREKERVAKAFQTSRILRMANEYRAKPFWYVWYADFRGRMYTTTAGFSPQGPDLAKGLLCFGKRHPLGDHGYYWMRVNMANRYGFDKASYDGRVAWVDERRESFRAAARDPLSNRSVWANADKPYQFLAACMEYDEALSHVERGEPIGTFLSYLPVGLDGSCNGLQNFSAMLRDTVGGRATNLVPAGAPADIYAEVARVCTTKLAGIRAGKEHDDPEYQMLSRWLGFCQTYGSGSIPRSMAKRPVMTLPYGATRQSCTKYIFLSIQEIDAEYFKDLGNFEAAKFLTPILWKSIGDVVIAARDAMAWLQKAASAVSKDKDAINWYTPDGFPVWQAQYKTEEVRVRTQLAGDFRLVLRNYTKEIDPTKQRLAISPNYVHSMDATHLRETVRLCIQNGVTELSTIHDDYGTHAGNVHILHKAIRQAFCALYEVDALKDFKEQLEYQGHELPELPSKGTLDIKEVMRSPYFFG